jgi:hypothetical protein
VSARALVPVSEAPRDYRAVLADRRRRGQASAWPPLDFVSSPQGPDRHALPAVSPTLDGAYGAGAVATRKAR